MVNMDYTEFGVSCFDMLRKTFENYFFSINMLGNVYARIVD